METKKIGKYSKPKLERFGTLRDLTQVGCSLGGDGVWICRVPLADEERSPERS